MKLKRTRQTARLSHFLVLFLALACSLHAQLDPAASYVEISYEGPVDSFSQNGSLQHDGSIGPDVPIYFSVKIREPDWTSQSIIEQEGQRSTSFLADIQFQFGNYTASESKWIRVIQFMDSADLVRFDIDLKPTQSNFSGTLYKDDEPMNLEELMHQNPIGINISFRNQLATLENVWDKLTRGMMNGVRFNLSWKVGDPLRTLEDVIRVYVTAGGINSGDAIRHPFFLMTVTGDAFRGNVP